MTWSWHIEVKARVFARLACLSLLMVQAGWQLAWAHPDLLLQIEELSRQLQAEPYRADLLGRRGDLYRRHGDFTSAAADLARARLAQPGYPALDYFEALLLLDTEQPGAAAQILDRYLANQPEDASGWVLRARARLALDHPDRAARDFAEAIRRAEAPPPALYRDWAIALAAAGESQWTAAGDAINQGLEQFPRDPALLALGIDLALAGNQPTEAENYFGRLPEKVNQLPQWQFRLELLHCLQGKSKPGCKPSCLQSAKSAMQHQGTQQASPDPSPVCNAPPDGADP